MPEVSVKVISAKGDQQIWNLSYDDTPTFRVRLQAPSGDVWSAEGGDLFSCLQKVRRQLERVGVKICVSGARCNAYPSSFSRETTGGYWIYLTRRWWRAKRVFIFSPAPCRKVSTVDEQEAYHDRWWKWVTKGRSVDGYRP